MKKLVILTLGLSAALPAFAATTPAASGQDPNERICRAQATIGTRLGRVRRCATRAEWVQLDRAEREALRRAQIQGNQPMCMNPSERAMAAGRYYALPSGCGN